jgi:hypothetical protein
MKNFSYICETNKNNKMENQETVPQKKKYYYVVQVKTFNEYWYMTSTCKYETFQEYRECMPLTDEQVIAYTKIPEHLLPSPETLPF